MITSHFVIDSKLRTEGDAINFQIKVPPHREGKGFILKKIEYPNLTYCVHAANNNLSMTISNGVTTVPVAWTLPVEDLGLEKNYFNGSLDEVLDFLNMKLDEAAKTWTLPAALVVRFYRLGKRLYIRLSYPRALVSDPTYNYTVIIGSTLGAYLGFGNASMTASSSIWTSGVQLHTFNAKDVETLVPSELYLCSKILGKYLNQRIPNHPYLLIRCPLDPDSPPSTMLTLHYSGETKVFPFPLREHEAIDFYFETEIVPVTSITSTGSFRICIFVEVIHSELSELKRIMI